QYGDNEKTKKEIKVAKKVAVQLKKDGWSFASHSWGHLNMTQASLEDVKKDNELWQQEDAPILGKTNFLIYQFGADISDWQPYSAEN
ncbi:polysaccharide deacetylase family protein, partial [Enterococcus faecium]|uniref:polysaccharide deacetylase family protein n=1 Tax=Enterococcus faecium TaxID=1352 RepID=UPI003CC6042A